MSAVLFGSMTVVCLILFIIFYLLKDTAGIGRYAMQVVLLGFIIAIVVLFGKLGIDDSQNCEWIVNNSTVVGNTTNYNYDWYCEAGTSTVGSTFYNLTLWIMRLTIAYIILAFAFEAIEAWTGKKKKKIDGEEE